jgi:FkbM family methyltransferase
VNPETPSRKLTTSDLLARGVYVDQMTSARRIQQLIRRLWPLDVGLELIRLGGEGDGGYLIPDDLQGIGACFSPGVADIAHFEAELLSRYGIPSHLADASVDGPPAGFIPKSFQKKFLGAMNNATTMTMGRWLDLSGERRGQDDLLLQMDIEGGEYLSVLSAEQGDLSRFRIMALEVHNVQSWGERRYFEIVEAFFEKLLEHFYVVHNHPNNCCGLVSFAGIPAPHVFELTLIRKDRVYPRGYAKTLPHPLDRPNLPLGQDLALPANWFYSRAHLNLPPAISPDWLFLQDLQGVIHVGANTGGERRIYDRFGLNVLWIEPIPWVFEELSKNIERYSLQVARQALIGDRTGEQCRFHVASNGGASSSIYDLKMHKEIWPDVDVVSTMALEAIRLDDLLSVEPIDRMLYDGLVIDTQGSELRVLRGAESTLSCFQWIKLEASDFEAYQGAALLDEISAYLASRSFSEVARFEIARHPSGGRYYDVLFRRGGQP